MEYATHFELMRQAQIRGFVTGGALLAAVLAAAPALAAVFALPTDGSAVVGTDLSVRTVYEDTLPDLAHRYSLGYYEIIRANPGVDVWIPGADKDIVLPGRRILPPGPREGIIVNLPEHRLYYYPKPGPHDKPVVITYPVSIGKMDWRTPLGETHIIAKIKNPAWYPPESVRKEHLANDDPLPKVVPAGPDNPLGDFAMRLAAGGGSYMIHGTNNPTAVGMSVTHGCIRMYPEDVAAVFAAVPVGTKVRLINEPVKIAWVHGQLLLEAHPAVDEEGQEDADAAPQPEPDVNGLARMLQKSGVDKHAKVQWPLARAALKSATGMPTAVGAGANNQAAAAGARANLAQADSD
jgi:L,D-transpeptidase ErfK/SrfK